MWQLAAYVAIAAAIILLSGCVTSGNGVRWSLLVPTTWPVFSGERDVNRARKAAEKLDRQAAAIAAIKLDAIHAAHLEFFKSYIVLGQTYPLQLRDLALRFQSNGLSLLDQADPLTAAERDEARHIPEDYLSGNTVRVAAAEAKQREIETANADLSRRLAATEEKAAKLAQLARKANADLRDTAAENITLANRVRIFRWTIGALAVLLVLAAAAAIYARLALGGVGAALHEAGAPAHVIAALDGQLSKLGQWLVRTGRKAAARAAARLNADKSVA
ncbi:MAG TPA: hypothetical protein VK163_08875 [Opitutaceae bacterium]|nr:hypothetical protein [Opitutaceae bacterium]